MDRSKWEYKKWADVLNIINGRDYKEVAAVDGAYPICGSGGEIGRASEYLCPENTVIIGRKGNINKPIFIEEKFWNIDTAFGLVAKSSCLIPRFLFYFCLHYDFERHNKAVTIPSWTKGDLLKIDMLLPSLSNQQRIVAELDCLNEMIAVKQEQLKEFDKLAQSIFYDMFGDPMDNVHEWGISILEDVVSDSCSISYGIVQPGEDVENGVPVVRPIDLVNQVVYKDGLKIVDKAISDSYKRTILKGDELLFCVRGTTGIISFASEELKGCNVTRGITPLEFGEKIDKYYAYYLLKTPYLQSLIAEKTNGIALKQINMRDVRLLPIMCPPLALQQQFAEKIQAIEAQKELVKQSIAETQSLLDYTMDYYFNK